jgi:copper transport protein
MRAATDVLTSRRPVRLPLLFGAVALLLLLGWPQAASAHAVLETSTIGPGAILPALPDTITLNFSEAVDPAFASGSLVTPSQEVVSPVIVSLDPASDRAAVFTISGADTLPAGSYALVWRVVSAVDGHATTGLLSFSAGTGVSPEIGSSTVAVTGGWPATLGRWLEFVSLMAITGAAFFAVMGRYDAPIPGLLRRLTLVTLPAGLLGLLLAVGALNVTTTGERWSAWPGWSVLREMLTDTSPGRALLLRAAALLGITLIALLLRFRAFWHAALAALLGMAGLASFSFTGHAAGSHGDLAIAVDLLHLLVAALWSGGLLLLALTLYVLFKAGTRSALELALERSRRFSAVAFASLATVTVTGVVSAGWNVSGPRNLTGEDYGLLLIGKVVAVLFIITVAAVNRLLLLPRLTAAINAGSDQAAQAQTRSLNRAALIELGIALVVLLLTALLTGLPPANGPLAVDVAARSGPIAIAATAGELQFMLTGELQSTPDGVIEVTVANAGSGAPVTDLARLIMLATAPNPLDPAGEPLRDRFDAEPVPDQPGVFRFPRSRLGVEAVWTLDLAARRLGIEDATATMELDLTGTAPQPPRLVDDHWRWPKTPWTGWLSLAAAATTVIGGLLLVRRLRGLEPVTAGIMLAVTALITVGFLLSAYRSGPLPVEGNPVTIPGDLADDTVIQRAASNWAQQCASCHGVTAGGTGESDATNTGHNHPSDSGDLLGPSSDALSSQERYWAITNGIGGTTMPAFDVALSDRDRWDLVAYLEWLQAQD